MAPTGVLRDSSVVPSPTNPALTPSPASRWSTQAICLTLCPNSFSRRPRSRHPHASYQTYITAASESEECVCGSSNIKPCRHPSGSGPSNPIMGTRWPDGSPRRHSCDTRSGAWATSQVPSRQAARLRSRSHWLDWEFQDNKPLEKTIDGRSQNAWLASSAKRKDGVGDDWVGTRGLGAGGQGVVRLWELPDGV